MVTSIVFFKFFRYISYFLHQLFSSCLFRQSVPGQFFFNLFTAFSTSSYKISSDSVISTWFCGGVILSSSSTSSWLFVYYYIIRCCISSLYPSLDRSLLCFLRVSSLPCMILPFLLLIILSVDVHLRVHLLYMLRVHGLLYSSKVRYIGFLG